MTARRFLIVSTATVAVASIATMLHFVGRRAPEGLLQEAAAALRDQQYPQAEQLAAEYLSRHPQADDALRIAGLAAAALHRHEPAWNYLREVQDTGTRESIEARFQAAVAALHLGRLGDAEQFLHGTLNRDPEHLRARDHLLFVLRIEGRIWESLPHIWELMRRDRFIPREEEAFLVDGVIDYVAAAGSVEWFWLGDKDRAYLEFCRSQPDADPLSQLGLAREALWHNRLDDARRILEAILQRHPEVLEAQARLGEVLVRTNSAAAFLEWHRRLPAGAEEHPEIWVVRGFRAQQLGEQKAAARCFWEALLRCPDHLAANYQLSQILIGLSDEERARPFVERVAQLSGLEYLIKVVRSEPDQIRPLVSALEALGRSWEAVGWCHVMVQVEQEAPWAEQTLARLSERLDPAMFVPRSSARAIDLAAFPLPEWSRAAGTAPRTTDQPFPSSPPMPASVGQSRVRFVDAAEEAGLKFSYFNAASDRDDVARMFEFSGGGVAAMDFDGDQWPDLYLTQGCAWPPGSGGAKHLDKLFRNVGGESFVDVTEQAGLGDEQYSQGPVAGDFNSDGFPDLYVTNIGANRHYRNNGDGTFSDVTAETGTAGVGGSLRDPLSGRGATGPHGEWSVGGVFADFNADGLPELYVVNYLGGPDVFTRVCRPNRHPVQCFPTNFPAEQDRLYLNLGDGRFEDITLTAGVVAPDGKGLGVVAADFDGSRKLGLFVANDTTPNFLFLQAADQPGGLPRFVESGMVRGVAVNGQGQAQSCMGTAAGDADGNGLLDLFVTNFVDEANNLFLQQAPGYFADEIAAAGLLDPGFALMGWGTQFIDGELDGWPDLIVANGHLEDLSRQGIVSRMPTVYYGNSGKGKFREVPGEQLGPYFRGRYLGRAVARLDWNRDGLEDVCVTHADAPVALLTNRTTNPGHFLSLTLKGVRSPRDPVGAIVSVTAGGRVLTRQLTAGDGFMASNQPTLIIGLGPADRVDKVVIDWPSGLQQQLDAVPVNAHLVIVEGRAIQSGAKSQQ